MAPTKIERQEVRSSDDVVRVRQQIRSFAVEAGLSLVDQTKIITAASELARNALVNGNSVNKKAASLCVVVGNR